MAILLDYRSPVPPGERTPWWRTLLNAAGLAFLGLALCSVLVPDFSSHGPSKYAKPNAAKVDLAILRDAVNQFRAEHGQLPTSAEWLDLLASRDGDNASHVWSGKLDPWGHRYAYRPDPAPGVAFEVRSAGPDGRFDTPDDIVWQ
jgi:hypothetical protein